MNANIALNAFFRKWKTEFLKSFNTIARFSTNVKKIKSVLCKLWHWLQWNTLKFRLNVENSEVAIALVLLVCMFTLTHRLRRRRRPGILKHEFARITHPTQTAAVNICGDLTTGYEPFMGIHEGGVGVRSLLMFETETSLCCAHFKTVNFCSRLHR